MKFIYSLIIVMLLALAGCDSLGSRKETSADHSGTSAQQGQQGANYGPGVVDGRTVYFDLDSSVIRPEYINMLERRSEELINSRRRLIIEGHGDERGSREYNIALGERRAHTVKQFLLQQGVLETQVNVVSYGEEVPQAYGHNEEAWSKNRRAVLRL